MYLKTILIMVLSFLPVVMPAAEIDDNIDGMALSGRRISSVDGLSGNTVYDLLQDKDGFVWMGAAYGLCRYDGYSFVNYYSLSSDRKRKMDATTGNLYMDEPNNMLWIHSSTFAFACYDLHSGRFVDYTGRGDETRPYRRFLRSGNDMWMYDTRSGIRKVTCDNGTFTCADYTSKSGALPSDNVPRMLEDGKRGIWALTARGLMKYGTGGRWHTVVGGREYIIGNTWRGNILCLSENNTVEMFSPKGRLLRRMVIPKVLGTVKTVRSNFVWGDKWMIFGIGTYSIDLNTFEVDKPEEYQVPNGLLLDSVDGYFFESNSTGRLWIFAPDGSMKELSLLPDVRFTAERKRKYKVRRGDDGLFYIASYGNGLFVYHHESGALRRFSADDPHPVIDNNYLMNIMIDRRGNLWVTQDQAGVSCISVSHNAMASFLMPVPGRVGDWSNYVRMTARDEDGSILVSTKDNKLYRLDSKVQSIEPQGETKACVFAYLVDRDRRKWMATRGDGLYVDGDYYSKYEKTYHVPSNDFYDIKQDSMGRVWLASYEEGLIVTKALTADGRLLFDRLLYRNINEGRQHQLELSPDGWLWIATSNGLYAVDTKKKNIKNADFKCFNTMNSDFPIDEMRCIRYIDGCLWAGGKGGGLVKCRFSKDMRMMECRTVTTKEGLADNTINSIIRDDYGSVWVATESGMSRIYGDDMKVKTYRFDSRLERNIYSEGCALRLDDGRLLFGTRQGLTVVTPRRNYDSDGNAAAQAVITDMRVNGIPLGDNEDMAVSVHRSDKITLGHNENTISLSFSNFEYAEINSSLYQYYLEGLDETWRQATSVNHVEYGNLAPGTYIFHIRSLSNNKWSGESTLTIVIRRPWYGTVWAWMVYIVIAAAFGIYLYHNARERLRLNQQMRIEKEMTEFRIGFFTNITHEFRTPLAIIQGAVDKLQAGEAGTSKAAVQTARRGVKRLLRLVNMLMEFRKVNTGNMRLNVEEGDIIAFVKDIYNDFWPMAKQKDISFTFTPFAREYGVPFDHQMVETIVYNIISNAIKYTPERGQVRVSLRKNDEWLSFSVEDDGPGMSCEQMAQLFQPFMRGYASSGGMGIGLYTSHRMAELHKGTLEYRPVDNGTGSVFTFMLPSVASAYSKEDYKKSSAVKKTENEENTSADNEIIRELRPDAINDITVAVVEDDPDMMAQICAEIGVYFNAVGYMTGQAALDGISATSPALIVCDVMLPDTTGYDIVKKLKGDDVTSRIPVIMLTAIDDENHRLRSYVAGADDYMVKPCNFKLLVGRAMQLINNARKKPAAVRQGVDPAVKSGKYSEVQENSPLLMSHADKTLKERIDHIVVQHIGNPEFTVDKLAAILGMGRTKMFTKIKVLTGVSPNKYLQNERMRIAAELLAEGRMTVSEVSYKVGIQDASYFNKCFKARYGVVPSKYGKTTASLS